MNKPLIYIGSCPGKEGEYAIFKSEIADKIADVMVYGKTDEPFLVDPEFAKTLKPQQEIVEYGMQYEIGDSFEPDQPKKYRIVSQIEYDNCDTVSSHRCILIVPPISQEAKDRAAHTMSLKDVGEETSECIRKKNGGKECKTLCEGCFQMYKIKEEKDLLASDKDLDTSVQNDSSPVATLGLSAPTSVSREEYLKIALELSLSRDKPHFIDTFRKLLNRYDREEISLSKIVEELNITAYKWAKAAHLSPAQSEEETEKSRDELIDEVKAYNEEDKRAFFNTCVIDAAKPLLAIWHTHDLKEFILAEVEDDITKQHFNLSFTPIPKERNDERSVATKPNNEQNDGKINS